MSHKIYCRRLAIFLIVATIYSHSFGQGSGSKSLPDSAESLEFEDSAVVPDEEPDTVLEQAQFPVKLDSLQHWKESGDFSYMKFLDSLLRKEGGLHSDTTSIDNSTGKKRTIAQNGPTGSFLNSLPLRIFFWALAIFFIGFIIYKLFLTDSLFAKRNKNILKEEDGEPRGMLEDASNYNALISEAESRNDYNLSMRFLYLQTIKMLIDQDLIFYSPGKTNCSYVKELTGKSYHGEFASLTLNYEYVWYGKFSINIDQYKQLKQQFISFNQKVS